MSKTLSLVYGLLCWAGFLGVFLYLVGFLGNVWVPKTVNSGVQLPMLTALLINVGLIALFGIHHSVAARPTFKQRIASRVPKHLERSTYVLFSNLLMILMIWQWKPMPIVIWHIQSEPVQIILYTLFGLGWTLVVLSSFLINHFDLMGVRQVYLHFVGKEYTDLSFKVRSLYKYVRNPLMLGWFVAFWCTPYMTVGHFVFSAGMTLYGIIGIKLEERNHQEFLGPAYAEYRDKTPMILPFTKR